MCCSVLPWISMTSVTSHGHIMSGRLIRVVIRVSVHVVVTACRRVSSCVTHFCTEKRAVRDQHDCTIVSSRAVHVNIWFLSMTCIFIQFDISVMSWMTSELLEPLFLFFLFTRPFRSLSNPVILTTSALLPNFHVTPDVNNVARLPMDSATPSRSSRILFLFIYQTTVSVYFWYSPVLFCQWGLSSLCSVSLRLGWSPVLVVCSTH